jgi:hypothetical protein
MVRIIKLEEVENGKHKWKAFFDDGTSTKFGQAGAEDYTMHRDKARRERYRSRHKKDLDTGDPRRAGYLSRFVLWGASTSLRENVKEFNRLFADVSTTK